MLDEPAKRDRGNKMETLGLRSRTASRFTWESMLTLFFSRLFFRIFSAIPYCIQTTSFPIVAKTIVLGVIYCAEMFKL